MTEDENNLKALKRDYDSLKYPGDLSADVPLDIQRPAVIGRIGGFLAIAAAMVIGVTCWMIWSPEQASTNVAQSNINNTNSVVNQTNSTQVAESELPSVTEIETTQLGTISAPSWSEISPSSGFASSWDSTTIPYQSITVPTLDEIDQQLTKEKNQSKQG